MSSSRTSYLLGIIDGLSFLAYATNIDISTYYILSVAAKLLLYAPTVAKPDFFTLRNLSLAQFIITLSIIDFVQLLAHGPDDGTIRIAVFCLSIIITSTYFGRNYLIGLILSAAAGNIYFLVSIYQGHITEAWGRYMYFNDAQPNLAGELSFALVFAAYLLNDSRLFIPCFTISLSVCQLTQSRAAIITICVFAAFYAYRNRTAVLKLTSRLGPLQFIAPLAAALLLFLYLPYNDILTNISNTLLIDDDARGIGSGASGRDEYWTEAWNIFLNNPFIGAGLSYPERLNALQPHNYFLWALAGFGTLGLVFLAVFSACIVRKLNETRDAYYVLISIIPLVAFNDRFINLNLYPFLVYIYFLHRGENSSELHQSVRTQQSNSLTTTVNDISLRSTISLKGGTAC